MSDEPESIEVPLDRESRIRLAKHAAMEGKSLEEWTAQVLEEFAEELILMDIVKSRGLQVVKPLTVVPGNETA